jgi:DNA ligase (NAD+)
LSEKTLEVLISREFLHTFKDIYHLNQYWDELIQIEGLGKKSVSTLLESIEKSRDIKIENFLNALCIPDIGLSTAKTIATRFDDFQSFIVRASDFNWEDLDGIGDLTAKKIKDFINTNLDEIRELSKEFHFILPTQTEIKENPFNGKSVAVTGKLNHFTRDSINAKLESLGAKPASGVTAKTDYLINNDPTSSSSKNKKANELNIPIITEEQFLNMIGG